MFPQLSQQLLKLLSATVKKKPQKLTEHMKRKIVLKYFFFKFIVY